MKSRVYESSDEFIVFDMGKDGDESWLSVQVDKEGVFIDHASPDCDLVLSPSHAILLGERLIAMGKGLGKKKGRGK